MTRYRKDIPEVTAGGRLVKIATAEVELKGGSGRFVARYFTFGGPDKDGDMQVPGSVVNEGTEVIVGAWGHGSARSELPVGRAVLRSDAKGALADGRFFLSSRSGAEHYEVVRAAGKSQEWSYIFRILEERRDDAGHRVLVRQLVSEVSPVLFGAGVGTATVSIDDPKAAAAVDDQAEILAIKARSDAWQAQEELLAIKGNLVLHQAYENWRRLDDDLRRQR